MHRYDHAAERPEDRRALLENPDRLTELISRRLYEISRRDYRGRENGFRQADGASAVLLLLGARCGPDGQGPCLILNKRSARVRQPGDICCPGGGITPMLDRLLSKFLPLPGLPLGRWSYWHRWHGDRRLNGGAMPLLLATGLREGFEEMRLNPLGFRFLGPMPPFTLRIFRRQIFPMVGWIPRQERFRPNWEVDRVVRIPLVDFWETERYANYRVSFSRGIKPHFNRASEDFPCFRFENDGRPELLWGVTYRIIMNFMTSVLSFAPPEIADLPVIRGRLRGSYITRK